MGQACTYAPRSAAMSTAQPFGIPSSPRTLGMRPRAAQRRDSSTASVDPTKPDRTTLQRLVHSILRVVHEQEGHVVAEDGAPIQLADARPYGGIWVLEHLWNELGLQTLDGLSHWCTVPRLLAEVLGGCPESPGSARGGSLSRRVYRPALFFGVCPEMG